MFILSIFKHKKRTQLRSALNTLNGILYENLDGVNVKTPLLGVGGLLEVRGLGGWFASDKEIR